MANYFLLVKQHYHPTTVSKLFWRIKWSRVGLLTLTCAETMGHVSFPIFAPSMIYISIHDSRQSMEQNIYQTSETNPKRSYSTTSDVIRRNVHYHLPANLISLPRDENSHGGSWPSPTSSPLNIPTGGEATSKQPNLASMHQALFLEPPSA